MRELVGAWGAGKWHFKFILNFGGLILGLYGLVVRLRVSVGEYCECECECVYMWVSVSER